MKKIKSLAYHFAPLLLSALAMLTFVYAMAFIFASFIVLIKP